MRPINCVVGFIAVLSPWLKRLPDNSHAPLALAVIQYAPQRRWYRYPVPRPGKTLSTIATHAEEAAKI